MNKFLLLLSFFISSSLSFAIQPTHAIRAAIDIGSGGPKLRIAEIDLTENKIIKILYIEQYPVIFQESLSKNSDKTLSHEIMVEGITALKTAIAVAKSFKSEGIVLIGASIFRNAVNADQFTQHIESETGIKLHILDQDLESKLAFQAALAKMIISPENLIVWDIGGGSTQFIGTTTDGSYLINGSHEGSGPFRDFIIESIQNRSLRDYKTPNPLSQEHAKLAEAYAFSCAQIINQTFKDKIKNPNTQVIGVGSVFGRGIISLVNKKTPFTIQDLAAAVANLIDKSDSDLGGGTFACIEASNALLTLGFMKGLEIAQMSILDINNADGALTYQPFWK